MADAHIRRLDSSLGELVAFPPPPPPSSDPSSPPHYFSFLNLHPRPAAHFSPSISASRCPPHSRADTYPPPSAPLSMHPLPHLLTHQPVSSPYSPHPPESWCPLFHPPHPAQSRSTHPTLLITTSIAAPTSPNSQIPPSSRLPSPLSSGQRAPPNEKAAAERPRAVTLLTRWHAWGHLMPTVSSRDRWHVVEKRVPRCKVGPCQLCPSHNGMVCCAR